MAKYNYKLKEKVVEAYHCGDGGYKYLAEKYGIKNKRQVLMILSISDFGYRRIYGELRKRGILVNKKKVQRVVQKLGLQVTSFARKSRNNI